MDLRSTRKREASDPVDAIATSSKGASSSNGRLPQQLQRQRHHKRGQSKCEEQSWYLDNTRMVTVRRTDDGCSVLLRELGKSLFKPKGQGIEFTYDEWKDFTTQMDKIDHLIQKKMLFVQRKSQ